MVFEVCLSYRGVGKTDRTVRGVGVGKADGGLDELHLAASASWLPAVHSQAGDSAESRSKDSEQ